ncbi:MAG TPA: GEVED domain-containing protein, partial [Cellvibrionaceae bacterium]
MLHANTHTTGLTPHLLRFILAITFIFISAHSSALTYCTAKGSVTSYEYIKGVTINGVTSNSTGQGYFLFASPTFQLNIGSSTATFTPGFSSSSYPEGWSVFIDLNQDGNFSTDERLIASASSSTINSAIVIPSTAKAGPTRMRVIMQYSSYFATGCGTFTYGEVEDYTVNINGSTTPPTPTPTPTTVSITTTAGYDRSYSKDLVINARFIKGGITYNSSNFYFANSATITKPITLDVDVNTKIEWSAQAYLDESPAGAFIPANCKTIVANKCTTTAGAFGETVIFKEQPPAIPPITPVADVTLDFNNMFGGAPYKAGPTINLGNGISATTTGGNFFNPVGAPFNWGYFSFADLILDFPAPVQYLSFKASSNCTDCSYTVNVLADGQQVSSFIVNYNQITNVSVAIPYAATKVSFSQSLKIDDLSVSYKTPPPPTKVSTTTVLGYDLPYNTNIVIEGRYTKDGVNYVSSTVYLANSSSIPKPITLDVDINTKIEWTAHVFLDNTPAGIFIPASCSVVIGNAC